ncbi:hypothetical protein [Nocardia brevicatena]|uniref:hypothetical protein n=1 Tax=Nocardia brevicatena TaxID=37327 RepID=UPI0005943F48|nr:hypothetical protein [Nocardia brevicatena]
MADGPRPPLEPDYYTHLGRLSLPAETRIVAGISHAHQSLDVQRQALDLAEDAIGHTLDIAAPCGLGRYPDADTARAMMKHSVTLAQRNWLGHPDRPHRLRRLLTRRLVPDLLT